MLAARTSAADTTWQPCVIICTRAFVRHAASLAQALPPEGVAAATEAVVARNAELVEAMDALRCCLRDEQSNLVQVLSMQKHQSFVAQAANGVPAACARLPQPKHMHIGCMSSNTCMAAAS